MSIVNEGAIVAARHTLESMPPVLRRRALTVQTWADRSSPKTQAAVRAWAQGRGLTCETAWDVPRRRYMLLIHHGFHPTASDRGACHCVLAAMQEL